MWGSSHSRSYNNRSTVLAVLCVVLPLSKSERLTAADLDQDDDESGTYGTLSLSDLKDVKLERITQRERMEYRSRGMRFHDISHKHFGGDSSDAFNVGSMVQEASETSSDLVDAKEARASKCPAAVLQEWESKGFLVKTTSKKHADVTCKGSFSWSPNNTAAVSCRPRECAGGAWCFVAKGCWRCRKIEHFVLHCGESSEPSGLHDVIGNGTASAPRSTNISTQLAPPLKIAPTQISGNVCVQFDLDLTVISGGTFPGLIGVGLTGEVHRIPTTKCYGWTLELFLQFSIGFDIAGIPFRLSFVFLGTLVVMEQPLDTAKFDLKWHLPFEYDTSICHTADPFVLVARTFKQQWKYVRTHILTFKTISHTEEKVRQALKDSNAAANMVNYVKLLKTEEKASWRTLAGLKNNITSVSSQGWIGRMVLTATWESESSDFLNISFTVPWEYVSDTTAFRFRLWQQVGPVILLHRSPVSTFDTHGNDVTGMWLVRVRNRTDVLGIVDFSEHSRMTKAAEFMFTWPKIGPEHTVSKIALYRTAEPRKGTFGVESIDVEMTACPRDDIQATAVVLSVRDEENPTAKWTREQFGTRFPWGAKVDHTSGLPLPREALLVFSAQTPVVRLEGLSTQGTLKILHEGANAYTVWAETWADFLSELRHELRSPSGRALQIVDARILELYVAKVMKEANSKEVRMQQNISAFLVRLAMETHKGTNPGASTRFHWTAFARRSISTSKCFKVGLDDLSADSNNYEACAEKCKDMRPASCRESACSIAACNTALYDKTDNFCSFWHCKSWDGFPALDGYDLVAMLPDTDLGASYDLEKILDEVSLDDLLKFGIMPLHDSELAQLIDDVASLTIANSTWQSEVFNAIFPPEATLPNIGHFSSAGSSRITDTLSACLGRDRLWERNAYLTGLLTQNWTWDRLRQISVELEVTDTQGNVGRKIVGLGTKLAAFSTQWLEKQTLYMGHCRAEVSLLLNWQMRTPAGYFKRPKLVPVAQALFVAYDQFVSKIPAYAEQVLERLKPKVEESGKFSQLFKQILPYDATNGRFLHRYLRKGEKDKLKVHEGDLGTDDAVFNFPKAMARSNNKGTSTFNYNVGLSVANLFIRVLTDVQALFFLYFADHPDWDGECASLPAKFNLFYEHNDAGPEARPREADTTMPNFRAGETVGKRGQPLTHDDQQLFLGWHWVSKPHWFYKHSSRAKFFTRTPPVHGKDKWATTELAELSAVMWPHVWCELVDQHWVKAEANLVSASMKGNLAAAERYASELLEEAPHETGKYSVRIWEIMQRGKQSLKAVTAFSCEEQGNKDALAGPETLKARLQDMRTFWDVHARSCIVVLEFYEEVLQKMREDLEIDADETEKGAPKLMQVEKLEGTLQATMELLHEEGTSLDILARSAIKSLTNQNKSDEDGILELARRRQEFESANKGLEIALSKKQENFMELQSHLARLLDAYPWSNSSSWSPEDLNDIRTAHSYTSSFWSVVYLQAAILAENKVLFSCIDLLHRPKPLPSARFLPWVQKFIHRDRISRLMTFIEPMKTLEHANTVDTVELFFDEACRVPLNYDFKSEMLSAGEPRPECERLFLSKAFITIFPQLTGEAMQLYQNFTKELQNLKQEPSEALVKDMLERLIQFVEGINKQMDEDFYTSFGYSLDGTLFGELWSSLPDSTTKILASLDQRTQVRQKWIAESIEVKAQLGESRRMRIRSPEPDKPEIPTDLGGCVCMEEWAAWVWYRLPSRTDFNGCTILPLDGHVSGAGNMTGWPGVCRAQQKRHSLEDCSKTGKLVRCDPSLLQDTRPTYKVWRRGSQNEFVTLPLLHMNLYLSFDVRSARADYCTPNFAPLLIKKTLHWSVFNWLPWEMRKSTCHGARLHPPGASLLMMRCRHSENKMEEDDSTVYEWQLVVTAYIISHYNTWGSSDGDMIQSWFSGGGSSSWATTTAQKGFPGVLSNTVIWSNSDAGFGYLNTENVVTSPAGFWFAVASEAMTAFAFSGSSLAGATQEEKKKNRWRQVMLASARVVWGILQRFAVVPQSWSVSISVRTAAKHLSKIAGVTFSPFRNEHDVILAMKFEKLFKRQTRAIPKLIGGLAGTQLHTVLGNGRWVHPNWDAEWRKYQEAHSTEDPENLAQDTLINVLQHWAQKVKLSEKNLRNLFGGCPRRPKQYQVQEDESVWPFFHPSHSAWMQPPLKAGTTMLLIETGHVGSGWLVQITDEVEEERYFPRAYISFMKLTVTAEFIDTPTHKPRIMMQEWFFTNLLKRADLGVLQCWTRAVLADMPEALTAVATVAKTADGLMAKYFSPGYLQKFVVEQWNLVSTDSSSKQKMSSLFLRGPQAQPSLNTQVGEEQDWFRHQSFACSLSVVFRIGLPFIKVPALLQVQPYMQFSVAYDVVDIFKSVWARVAAKPGSATPLQMHEGRVKTCRQCIKSGQAFCDRRRVASNMLKDGFNESSMDRCMPKTADAKAECKTFEWDTHADGQSVYKEQVCPCYEHRTGIQIRPRWITSEEHCNEMRFPQDWNEDGRRQLKASDFKLGFASQAQATVKQSLVLGDKLAYDGPKGCKEGFKCCGATMAGKEMLRCVHLDSIAKGSWFKGKKCKNYDPKDVKADGNWKHIRQEFRCAPVDEEVSSFDGHWHRSASSNEWEKVASM